MRGGETDIQELIAEANTEERGRIEDHIDLLEDQRRELVVEYEAMRDAIVEELRPLRRWVANRQSPNAAEGQRAVEQRRRQRRWWKR